MLTGVCIARWVNLEKVTRPARVLALNYAKPCVPRRLASIVTRLLGPYTTGLPRPRSLNPSPFTSPNSGPTQRACAINDRRGLGRDRLITPAWSGQRTIAVVWVSRDHDVRVPIAGDIPPGEYSLLGSNGGHGAARLCALSAERSRSAPSAGRRPNRHYHGRFRASRPVCPDIHRR